MAERHGQFEEERVCATTGFSKCPYQKLEKNQGVELWRPQLCRKLGLPGAPQRAGGKASLSSSASDLPECTPQTPSFPPHTQMFHFAEFLPWMMESPRHTAPGASNSLPGREQQACSGGRFQVSFLFCLQHWALCKGSHDHKLPEQLHLQHAQLHSLLQPPAPLANKPAVGARGHLQKDLSSA